MSRVFNGILSGMAVLAGILLLFITFSISYSIFTRTMGYQSPVWTVQFNEYSLLWITFLGSAWALNRRKHVSMDVVTGRFKPRARRIAETVHSIMGIGVCAVLCWYTSMITWNLFQRGVTDVQAMDVPKGLIIMVIPIGFLVLTLQFVRNLISSLRNPPDAAGGRVAEAPQGEALEPGEKESNHERKGN